MNKLRTLTFFCIFFIVMTNVVFAADRWQWIASNDSVDFFIDMNTIKSVMDDPLHSDKSKIYTWVKSQTTAGGMQSLTKILQDSDLDEDVLADIKNVAYRMSYVECDLEKRQIRTVFSQLFHADATPVENTIKKTPDAEWLPIIPDTRSEMIFNGIQRYISNYTDSLQQNM
ncbi:hypothetical protein [Propionispira raffinosivorans]|uniref:hypothetical protein n=1 Tax=Propionispira raffinosivorans TaxID=86959 RepID=UPI0003708E61|nr:hypothetical protein [Propionispira raffinosivorans]